MSYLKPKQELFTKIAHLYDRMEEAYGRVAGLLNFSCQGCPDNCCDSYFLHHTHVEWFYLWEGLDELTEDKRRHIETKSAHYVLETEKSLDAGERPQLMCPLNDNGLCALYRHRLMICRMHGVPSSMTRPDGKAMSFPGCFRCQEIVGERSDAPVVDRTQFYQELADLERNLIGAKIYALPKVKLTIAQMIVKGRPVV